MKRIALINRPEMLVIESHGDSQWLLFRKNHHLWWFQSLFFSFLFFDKTNCLLLPSPTKLITKRSASNGSFTNHKLIPDKLQIKQIDRKEKSKGFLNPNIMFDSIHFWRPVYIFVAPENIKRNLFLFPIFPLMSRIICFFSLLSPYCQKKQMQILVECFYIMHFQRCLLDREILVDMW